MSEYVYGTDGHEGHWLTGEKIVRCRDCEFYNPDLYLHISCEYWYSKTEDDDFCSHALRRLTQC